MVQFTKKLIYVGNSKGVTFPPELIELLRLQIGDYVTLEITDIHDKDEVKKK